MFAIRVDDELELVILEHRHASALFALVDANRAHLRQWLPWVDQNASVADTVSFVQHALDQFAKGLSVQAGLSVRGELAGVCGFHTHDWANRRTAIGYWLAKGFEGKGLMTRSVRAMTRHAFLALGMNRVEIRAALDNRRSRSIPERLGYRLEGECRQAEWLYDRWVDHAIYGALASEWHE